jgi:hypothetical protein
MFSLGLFINTDSLLGFDLVNIFVFLKPHKATNKKLILDGNYLES